MHPRLLGERVDRYDQPRRGSAERRGQLVRPGEVAGARVDASFGERRRLGPVAHAGNDPACGQAGGKPLDNGARS